MMNFEVKQLRAGNGVLVKGKKCVIEYSHISGVKIKGGMNAYYQEVEPIPLDEEAFLALGFQFWAEELGVKSFYIVYGCEFICVATNGLWQLRTNLKPAYGKWEMGNYPLQKFVHQIQNTYWGLTGQELPYNPAKKEAQNG